MPVFEEYKKPKRQPDLLADEVAWRSIAAPGVVLQKDRWGTLQRSYAVRGPDAMGQAWEVLGSRMIQANQVLMQLGGEWMLQSEAQRLQVETLPPLPETAPALVRLLDAAYREELLAPPGLRETTYYITLCWTPPPPSQRSWLEFFRRGPGNPALSGPPEEVSVIEYLTQCDFFMDLLAGVLAQCKPLTTVETLNYLHTTVSDRWHTLKMPGSLADIDYLLCDTRLSPAGWYPQLGNWHIRTCSLKAYPRESIVGMLRRLEALPIDFRWCTRWLGMEKHAQQGILRRAQHAWVHEEKGLTDRLSENITHEGTRILNRDATNKAEDVDVARQEVGADVIAFGEFTSTVTVWNADPEQAGEERRLVMQAFNAAGIGTVEEQQHQTAAWLSSHPGNRLDNVNQTHQSTYTLAHLCPGLTAAWRGPSRDAYLQGGPWFYARTEHNTLFRVVNHLYDDASEDFRDLGHFLLLGFTGAGKSTLANWLRLMWLQYAQTQAILFDLDKHGRLLTLLLGGRWYDLGAPAMHLQPLRHIDDELRRGIALQWLLDLMEEYHVQVTGPVQAHLGANLLKLARYPASQRTLSQLLTLMADGARETELKARAGYSDAQGIAHPDADLRRLVEQWQMCRWVLQRFTHGGEYLGLFDGTEEDFDDNPVQTFELRDLLAQSRLLGPVLRYVLPQIEFRMSTDHPMWLMFDDAAIPWEVPRIRHDTKAWMRTARKKGVSLGFATHSLADVFETELGPMLMESCPVRFYLYNPEASKPSIRAIYRRLGLEDPAIDQIAIMRPQREAYYELREMGQRPFSLHFPRIILDCIARNTAADHRLIDEILQKEGPEGFTGGWLRHHGYEELCHDYGL